MNGGFEGKFGVKSDDFRFSPQNRSSKSILRQNFAIKFFIECKATEIESFLQSTDFTPQKCHLKVCVSFCTTSLLKKDMADTINKIGGGLFLYIRDTLKYVRRP